MTLFESRLKSKLASPGLSLGLAQGVHACPEASGSRSSGLVISCSRSVLRVRGRLLHEPQGSLAGGLHTEAGSSKERLQKSLPCPLETWSPSSVGGAGLQLKTWSSVGGASPQAHSAPGNHSLSRASKHFYFLSGNSSQEAALIQVAPPFKLFSELNIISGFQICLQVRICLCPSPGSLCTTLHPHLLECLTSHLPKAAVCPDPKGY